MLTNKGVFFTAGTYRSSIIGAEVAVPTDNNLQTNNRSYERIASARRLLQIADSEPRVATAWRPPGAVNQLRHFAIVSI